MKYMAAMEGKGYSVHKAAVVRDMAAVQGTVAVQDILVEAVDQGMANQRYRAVDPAAGPGKAN